MFSLGIFPEVGQNQKMKREKERPKVGNNNGQLGIATPPRVAHAKIYIILRGINLDNPDYLQLNTKITKAQFYSEYQKIHRK